MNSTMPIEKKAAQNRVDLNELQKKLGIRKFRVLLAPDVRSSEDESIAGCLKLVRSIFAHPERECGLSGDLDAELI